MIRFSIYITIILINFTDNPFDYIQKINRLQKEAYQNYRDKKYDSALDKYETILSEINLFDQDNLFILLNQAHCNYKLYRTEDPKQTRKAPMFNYFYELLKIKPEVMLKEKAENSYKKLVNSKDPSIKSIAYLQLGLMAYYSKKEDEALLLFKQSLENNPNNYEAAYNFELLKRKNSVNDTTKKETPPEKITENPKSVGQPDQKNNNSTSSQSTKPTKKGKIDPNSPQSGFEKKNSNKQSKSKKITEDISGNKKIEKLVKSDTDKDSEKANNSEQEDELTQEKAESILETMKSKEIQYWQQKKRDLNKKTNNDKLPDW